MLIVVMMEIVRVELVVHDVRLYTVVVYGDDVCCSVVFGTLVCV